MIHTGETENPQTATAESSASMTIPHLNPLFLSIFTTGTTIKATTAGRIPQKIRSTTGWVRMSAKKKAISKIAMNEGIAVPKTVAISPP